MLGIRFFSFVAGIAFFTVAADASGVGRRYDNRSPDTFRSVSEHLDMLKMELANHEAEIRVLQEKIVNQEDIIEALRHELDQVVKESSLKVEGTKTMMVAQEGNIKGFVGDLDRLRSHANESATKMEDHQGRLRKLEDFSRVQSDNINNMQAALRSILEALKAEGDNPIGEVITYQVKAGDSLGLIAKRYKTTIKEIKTLNKLKNDTIVVGQKLTMPDRPAH